MDFPLYIDWPLISSLSELGGKSTNVFYLIKQNKFLFSIFRLNSSFRSTASFKFYGVATWKTNNRNTYVTQYLKNYRQ